MDATIMRSTTSLTARLSGDFPELSFAPGDEFRWSPKETTVFFIPDSDDLPSLLHEVAHALLHHVAYTRDIELVKLESDAWRYAATHLGPAYKVAIGENIVEDSLDTYREWLHARATCPQCEATGMEIRKNTYQCLGCHTEWQVNDARVCSLRRYTLKK